MVENADAGEQTVLRYLDYERDSVRDVAKPEILKYHVQVFHALVNIKSRPADGVVYVQSQIRFAHGLQHDRSIQASFSSGGNRIAPMLWIT